MSHKKPNVVLILTDDQGYGDLACLGNPVLQTPNLDRLHAESVRLTNYHVGPTCAPTRAGLFTGHYANSTGVWHTIGGRSLLRREEVSMADFFSRAGYATGLFGKWHLGDNYPYRPQDRGYQEVVTHGGGGVGNTPDYWGNNYMDDTYWTGDSYRQFAGYCTDVWFAEGLQFIERHRDHPFFCTITPNAPHSPHIVPPAYSDFYRDNTPNADRANFYGMVTAIDENIGTLRRALDAWDLADNTVLIFMTDNGSAGGLEVDANHFVISGFNAGMRGKKNSEYDGGHRVPCFIHWPRAGIAGGRDVSRITANVDLLPTLLELCALDVPDAHGFDGQSLAPLLRQNDAPWPDRILVTDSQRLAYPIKWRKSAVMTDRWRLINGGELYDMFVDPEQRLDVASDHPQVVAYLRQAYEAWWEKVSTQFDEEIPIVIGDDQSRQVLLTSHDWRNEDCECAWNQSDVRAGKLCNGYWELDIARAGTYRIELRRWPRELRIPLCSGMEGAVTDYADLTWETGYGGGEALAVISAELRVGEVTRTASVADMDEAIVFELDLPAGATHLSTRLKRLHGQDLGAYYVHIEAKKLS